MMMEVRSAAPDDASAIAQVHVESSQAAYRDQVPQRHLASQSVVQRHDAWQEILRRPNPGCGVLVLADPDRVVGFLDFGPSRDGDAPADTGEIASVYLLPEIWGHGWGRMLMGEGVGRLRQAGFRRATLWVLDTNRRARRFYESVGWVVEGAEKREDWRGFGLKQVRYRRGL